MAVPQAFPTPSEQAIASYSYSDIAEGTGIVKYYGYVSQNVDTKDYHCSTDSAIYSVDIEHTDTSAGSGSWDKVLDFDFDLSPFNLPHIIDGTALFQCGLYCTAVAGNRIFAYPHFRVRKWDGTTETEIANISGGAVLDNGGGAGEDRAIFAVPVDVPLTHFKKGETLRITTEVWTKHDNGENGTVTIGLDPNNRDGTNIVPSTEDMITQLIFHVPFKLDL